MNSNMYFFIVFSVAMFSLIISSSSIIRNAEGFDSDMTYYDMTNYDSNLFNDNGMSIFKIALLRPFRVRIAFNLFALFACAFVIYYLVKHAKNTKFQPILLGLFAFMTLNHFINIILYAMLLNFNNVNNSVLMTFNVISILCSLGIFGTEAFKYFSK
jgi:hypothetical protein